MSKYHEINSSYDVLCPYCRHKYQPEMADCDEYERVATCDKCGKKYFLSQIFDITHVTRPDCEINGEQHQLVGHNNASKTFSWQVCTVCGLVTE